METRQNLEVWVEHKHNQNAQHTETYPTISIYQDTVEDMKVAILEQKRYRSRIQRGNSCDKMYMHDPHPYKWAKYKPRFLKSLLNVIYTLLSTVLTATRPIFHHKAQRQKLSIFPILTHVSPLLSFTFICTSSSLLFPIIEFLPDISVTFHQKSFFFAHALSVFCLLYECL